MILGSSTEQQYEFDESPVRIGRNPINNIVLDEDCVSGWHGIVRFDQRAAYYSDLGSTNGTLLGGARLPKSIATPIREPIRLTISVFELTIVTRAGATLALDCRSAPSPLIVGASGHSGQGQAIPASAVAKTQIASPVKGGSHRPSRPKSAVRASSPRVAVTRQPPRHHSRLLPRPVPVFGRARACALVALCPALASSREPEGWLACAHQPSPHREPVRCCDLAACASGPRDPGATATLSAHHRRLQQRLRRAQERL